MTEWIDVRDRLPEASENDFELWCIVELWICGNIYGAMDYNESFYEHRYVRPATFDPVQKIWSVYMGEGDIHYCNALIDSEDLPTSCVFVSHWSPFPEISKIYDLPEKPYPKFEPEIEF